MNIGVETTALAYGATGVCRYIRCILDELQQIDSQNRYTLFECKESDYKPVNPNWKKLHCNRKMRAMVWLQLTLPKLLKEHNIDVVWTPTQICPVLRMPSRIKIAVTVHDFAVLRYPEMITPLNLFLKRFLIPMAIKKSAALMPVSEYVKRELIEFYPYVGRSRKIIKTVGNGAKDLGGGGKSVKRENFLFFPGNLEPRKNHLRLFKALEIVTAAGFDLNLRLAGPAGWKNVELFRQMNSGPLKDRIKYLGFVTDEELRNQYLSCAALIFPSIYEGFGIPVLEALKLGTPVLTSRGTVMEEIAGESAMYFDPYDADSIAATIINFLKTGGAPINHNILERYTWRRAAESMLEVFEELM